MHKVKCPFCEKTFDTEKEPFKQISARRWAHLSCYEENEKHRLQEGTNIEVLKDYINKIYKDVEIDWPRVMQQIKSYAKMGWTYSGIQRTLIYCFEIKHLDPFKSNGHIGIVKTFYPQAYNYYKGLFNDKQKSINSYKPKQETKIIKIKPPAAPIKIKLFDLGDDTTDAE